MKEQKQTIKNYLLTNQFEGTIHIVKDGFIIASGKRHYIITRVTASHNYKKVIIKHGELIFELN